MICKNAPIPIPEMEYRYKFWGFPTGVVILPRFAAMVCNTITGIISCSRPVIRRTRTVNGTKVKSATSLVIHMEVKKHKNTSTRYNWRKVFTFSSNFPATAAKNPVLLKPSITVIRQNSNARTR